MTSPLIGKKVTILANDFLASDLLALIVAVDECKQTLLLEFDSKHLEIGEEFTYAVASPRLSPKDITLLSKNKLLSCSVTWVPNVKFNEKDPMDLSWWRGGGAAITDLRVYESND